MYIVEDTSENYIEKPFLDPGTFMAFMKQAIDVVQCPHEARLHGARLCGESWPWDKDWGSRVGQALEAHEAWPCQPLAMERVQHAILLV